MATFQVQVIFEPQDLIDNYLYSKGFILSTSRGFFGDVSFFVSGKGNGVRYRQFAKIN
jgi:hypothetical protein